MPLIATHSGLRGRPGVELTHEVVTRTLGGFLGLLRRRRLPSTVGVARDERPEGEALAAEVIERLRAGGADVVDFGAVSTPGAKLAARSRKLGGAVVVTGSHLGPELTGLKLVVAPTYGPFDPQALPRPGRPNGRERRGRLSRVDGASREHVDALCGSVDVELVRAAGLSVECAGGAGPASRLLLERLWCGRSARPEVTFRLDADGDRLELGDERGSALDTELTLPLVLLALDARTIVKSADTSRVVDALAADRGGTVRVVSPGEIHLVEALADGGGDLAGEGNGGAIIPAVGLARDGLAAAAAILSLLARRRMSLSELAGELPRLARRRSTIPCSDPERASGMLEALASQVGVEAGGPHTGIQVEARDGAWGLVRLSASEPVLRVTAEAPTRAGAEGLHAELRAALLDGQATR